MGNRNVLFESIFKRKLSDDGTREHLTEITHQYPYFSLAQFFLLLQTEKGTVEYRKQAAKTSALFNNLYWLQFQLQEKLLGDAEINDSIETENDGITNQSREALLPEIIVADEASAKVEQPDAEQNHQELITESKQLTGNEDSFRTPFHSGLELTIANEEVPGIETSKVFDPGVQMESEQAQADENNELAPAETILPARENESETRLAGTEIERTPDDAPVEAEVEEKLLVESTDLKENDSEAVSEEKKDETEVTPTLHAHFNNDSTPLVNEAGTEEEPVTETEIAPLNFKLKIDTPDTTEDTITFEPLHTSDYFASLGIKLSGEIKPADKLGKQLKSFTEWLKTMKKIHGDQLPPLSGQADVSIQKLAEQSNKEDAILTEAMADVLLQQGKAGKAIEVYKKLSLLNPSKSTYFAAKIDQLKEH